MSRMARACSSSMSSRSCRPCCAADADSLPRISAITASIWSIAFSSALTMCARSWARRSRYWVRRTITLTWCVTQCLMSWSSRSVRGTPSTSASMFAPNVSCSWVCLYRLFSTTLATASRLRMITSRWPVRPLLSSLMSAIPPTRPSRTSSAIFAARFSGLTW